MELFIGVLCFFVEKVGERDRQRQPNVLAIIKCFLIRSEHFKHMSALRSSVSWRRRRRELEHSEAVYYHQVYKRTCTVQSFNHK